MAPVHRMVRTDGLHEIEIRKSRFICHLFRVVDEAEARERIEFVRAEHWSANHNCTAWIIGEGGMQQRSNDDGEPSGTAGMPMLEVLRRREVTDTLAVVTRYFGGIMLGVGGLIRAYGGAVSEALDTIGIVERVPLAEIMVSANYEDAGRIEHAIRLRDDLLLDDVAYGTDVTFVLLQSPAEVPSLQAWVQEISNGAYHVEEVGVRYTERPAPSQPEPTEGSAS